MPSGAKKRKVAKRRKEQQQQQQRGARPPGSPTSPTTGRPQPSQGNGEKEEEDDLTSPDGKGSESGSDFASPTARNSNHHQQQQQQIEVGPDEEQAEARVKNEGREKAKKESDTTGSVDTVDVMESTDNSGSEPASETLAPQKTEDEVTKKSEAEAPVAVIEIQKDAILPEPVLPADPIPSASAEVLISKLEEVITEQVQSEKGKEVAVSRDAPPSSEHKESDEVDAASPVELSVPISEGVVQAVPVETLKVVESVAEAQSFKDEVKSAPLTSAASEQPKPSVESHPHTETRETTGTTGVAQPTQLEQRTSWLNCCGLLDVITGANR